MKSVFVSAGEVSGDHYAASAAKSMKDKGFDGRIYGLCGKESGAAGIVEVLWNNDVLHVMGISEVFGAIGAVWKLLGELKRNILKTRPDAVVMADSPDFHLPLARSLRRNGYGGKIFYIAPPSVWAWRKYRARALAKHVNVCFPLFAFEHDALTSRGCDSRWIGHPLVEEFMNPDIKRGEVVKNIKGPPVGEGTMAALLPGSRRSEIEPLYPVLSGLYRSLEANGVTPVFSVAPGLSEAAGKFLTERLDASGERYYEGPGRELMGAADVVVGASGTATAEALLLRRYMVVMYKVSFFSSLVGHLLLRGVKFALPNILAGEYFYPELIQERATAENALAYVRGWLGESARAREERVRAMDGLAAKMGRPGAAGFWAEQILGELK
ncbi:MAG: lipid-A-disaccharide synthase [Synergistaceae bacterium]|nr:lipid-A-disaccharide synthase [Synergistaceae bacterium]